MADIMFYVIGAVFLIIALLFLFIFAWRTAAKFDKERSE